MSNNITSDMLDKAIQQQTDELISVIQNFMQQVDERFNKLETSLDRLTNTIDGFVKKGLRMPKLNRGHVTGNLSDF